MANPNPRLTQDVAYFCPQCGTPALERSALAGGEAACKACPWKGKTDELDAVPFSHDFANGEEGFARFVSDVTNTFVQHAGREIGSVLLKWGFFTSTELIPQEMPVYGRAIGAAVVKAILEVREGLATGKIKRHPKKPEAQRRGVH